MLQALSFDISILFVATVLGFIVRAYAQKWDNAAILLGVQLIPADFYTCKTLDFRQHLPRGYYGIFPQ